MVQLLSEPSVSSTDPLTWSRPRKEFLFATIILGSCATGSLGPLLVPGFAVVAADLQVDLTSVTLLNGSLVMALGISAYACSAFARCFGKRPVYLFTTLLVLASCCWAAAAKSYCSLIASRVFQGLGMGSFFALAGTASINEVFGVHERGRRVGLWNFAVIVSVNLTPVISGYVITALSWRWAFWLEAILFGVLLGAILLFFPETTFHTTHNTNSETETTLEASLKTHEQDVETNPVQPVMKGTNLLRALIDPLALAINPIVIWGCLMWSVTFTWTILLGAVASQIFTAPPWSMSTVAVGNLTGIAPLIGSALGTVLGGWLCDLSSRLMASHNAGVYEPEYRLPVMLPATIAMAVGAFGLAAATDRGYSAVLCGVFMAIVNFAVGMGCTGIVAYTNDVLGTRAGDGFGLAMVAKSAFAFGLSFVFNDFSSENGVLVFFATFGAVSVGVMFSTLLLWVWGGRIRGAVRVAVTQAEPIWLDLNATVAKTVTLIAEAASNGAQLISFPECWIPGYPAWIWSRPVDPGLHTEYMKNALSLPSPQLSQICTAAREHKIIVVLGFVENHHGTLYIAQGTISSCGEILTTRRKIKATHMERTVFGDAFGAKDCLSTVVDTELGRVGALSCWEHIQPLLKFHTISQRERIHVAAWPPLFDFGGEGEEGLYSMSSDGTMALARTYAIESGSFVLHTTAVISEAGIEKMCTANGAIMNVPGGGSSAVFGPDGRMLAGGIPATEEGIVYADLDMDEILKAKAFVDVVGHYSRPDLLWLGVGGGDRGHVREG
ncbi:carbon-nitrogen hydrolase [Aspergillus stella-maris]|uniref:carbon-nitrogen hydrolase n=1 Tax=Aspergillus stella-maris TaxID=1810926 RepID=UPI003CCD2A93